MGKGSTVRPFDRKKFYDNWDKIKWKKEDKKDEFCEAVLESSKQYENGEVEEMVVEEDLDN